MSSVNRASRRSVALAVILLCASCGSGSEESTADSSPTSEPSSSADGANIPTLRGLSEPASSPIRAPGTPVDLDAAGCAGDAAVVHPGDVLPAQGEQWLVIPGDQVAAITDAPADADGRRLLALPSPVVVRAPQPPARSSARADLVDLSPATDIRAEVTADVSTSNATVDAIGETNLDLVEAMLLPLLATGDPSELSAPFALLELRGGTLILAGPCPDPLEIDLNLALAAARQADMSGSSIDLLTSLSNTELFSLMSGQLR